TKFTAVNETNTFTALADPAPGEILQYAWSVSIGTLQQTTGSTVDWLAPASPAAGTVAVEVTNQDLLSTTVTAGLLVKDTTLPYQDPLIWYPFDTDNKNAAADRFHATATGVTKTEDARGKPLSAYRFTSGSNIIYTENNDDLNFNETVSLSCWLKCETLGSERFVISHGSWQQRYKLSVTPEGYLRWTVKTETGIADLDSSEPIELNRFYHVTAIYSGYSMELFVDGELDTFIAFSGDILLSTKPLTIGRMDNTETLYSWRGSIDEVKIWDREVPVPQVMQLKDQWATPFGIRENEIIARVYPNPAAKLIFIEFIRPVKVTQVALFASDGRKATEFSVNSLDSQIILELPQLPAGIYALRVFLNDGNAFARKIIIR
ncbi:MAG: LamG-like jellyroll fold domain-containing protein, partial [Bacteroidales bacterium]